MLTFKLILVALLASVMAIPTWIYPGEEANHTVAIPTNNTDTLFGEIPASFSWRNNRCRSAIQNQGGCGSCWAFTASGAMNDRFCIASGGKEMVQLSPQYAVSCSHTCVSGVCNRGCAFGQYAAYITYMNQHGIPSQQCVPYDPYGTDQCPAQCKDGSNMYLYKSGPYYIAFGVENMMRDIVAHGPIMVQYKVYSDFGTCGTNHVYQRSPSARFLYNHALIITGFGTLNGVPYWEIANSYGTHWGDGGYCYIRRGVNECNIESFPIGAIPVIGGPSSGGSSGSGNGNQPVATTTTITSPTSTTTVDIGSIFTVSWRSTSSKTVKISLGNDVIATNQPASGRLSFMIPTSFNPGKYPLTVSNDKTSTIELVLVSAHKTSPNFITPTQGQSFKSGGSIPVKVPITAGEAYTINLCTSTSNCPYTLASGVSSTNNYLYTTVSAPASISGSYMLQFVTHDNIFFSPSFTILSAPSLNINTPSSATAGQQLDLTWSTNGASYCSLALLQNGRVVQEITGDTQNDGFYAWTIPDNIIGSYSVQIKCGGSVDVTTPFQVSPASKGGNGGNTGGNYEYKLAYKLPIPSLVVGKASVISWTCSGNCPSTIPISFTQGSHTFPITTAANKVGSNSVEFTPDSTGQIYLNIGAGNYVRITGPLTVNSAGSNSISINLPAAGTKVAKGAMINVGFTETGLYPPYTLTLIQGGSRTLLATSSYTSVAAEIPNIPSVKAGDARIEVSSGGISATSATFTITNAKVPPSGGSSSSSGNENTGGPIVIKSPSQGEKIYGATPFTVSWNGGNGPYTISLYQSSNGHFFQTFGTDYTGTSAEITIPRSVLSNLYYVTVSETNDATSAASSDAFSFSSSGGSGTSSGSDNNHDNNSGGSTTGKDNLVVVSPPAGSAYYIGSKFVLAWQCTPNCGDLGDITIEIVDTNMDNGRQIYSGPNYGFYAFDLPSVPSGNYLFMMQTEKVKVYSPTYKIINKGYTPNTGSGSGSSGDTGSGSSSGTGSGSVNWTAPSNGIKIPEGSSFILKWTSSGLPSTLDIYIVGPTKKQIMSGAPNSGYLKIDIPSGIPEGDYSIVLEDASGHQYKSPTFSV